jgi:hypothetical protein
LGHHRFVYQSCEKHNIVVEQLKLQGNSTNYLNFRELLEGDSYFYNVYMLLEFSYHSECILNITKFAENVKVQIEFLIENI